MPLQNRVLATGEIVSHTARGMFMGNRGILHGHSQSLGRRRWQHKAWIICNLVHKDWHRDIMQPGNYTELFFLDEAVALAAGHRPCKLCRRKYFKAYVEAAGFPGTAPELDKVLHDQRAIPRTFKPKRWTSQLCNLPDNSIVLHEDRPCLKRGNILREVHPHGYGAQFGANQTDAITVLTPPISVDALNGGYIPALHPSL